MYIELKDFDSCISFLFVVIIAVERNGKPIGIKVRHIDLSSNDLAGLIHF